MKANEKEGREEAKKGKGDEKGEVAATCFNSLENPITTIPPWLTWPTADTSLLPGPRSLHLLPLKSSLPDIVWKILKINLIVSLIYQKYPEVSHCTQSKIQMPFAGVHSPVWQGP